MKDCQVKQSGTGTGVYTLYLQNKSLLFFKKGKYVLKAYMVSDGKFIDGIPNWIAIFGFIFSDNNTLTSLAVQYYVGSLMLLF